MYSFTQLYYILWEDGKWKSILVMVCESIAQKRGCYCWIIMVPVRRVDSEPSYCFSHIAVSLQIIITTFVGLRVTEKHLMSQ